MKLVIELDLPKGATPLDDAAIREEYPSLIRELLVGGTQMKALRMAAYMGKIGQSQEEINKVINIYEYQADLFDTIRMRIED